MTSTAGPGGVSHLLSFDVEAYFQVEAAAGTVSREAWDDFPLRLERPVNEILELLSERGVIATFFVLGYVARREPRLVRLIAEAGHEIATHGTAHQMLTRMTPDEFRRDLASSRALLEDLSGQKVSGYRAPTFSITRETTWALDVLVELGFRYDSSIFPIPHDRYGMPGAPRFTHRVVAPSGGTLVEIPPLTLRLFGTNLPAGGGGYLRLFPLAVVKHALKVAERRGRPGMIYLHPWELDPEQPVLPMSLKNRWRHRVGLKGTKGKLRRLLDRFRFASVRDQLDALEAGASETFSYETPPGG